jgi:hypothetical protein
MGLSPNPQGMSPIGSLRISFFAVFGERPDVPKALSPPPPTDVLEVEFRSKMKELYDLYIDTRLSGSKIFYLGFQL